ncbi:hypothetical protein AB0K00_40565 [Dactylosporangium sp. NPDC049525]|uniref:hypothetical protein n=1 Tax=Dactylosporangium sp. NPDC049525 TaxID=3154730 RepID=UPI00342071B6
MSLTPDGTDLFDTALRLRVSPAPEHDLAPEVVAAESPLDNAFPSTVVEGEGPAGRAARSAPGSRLVIGYDRGEPSRHLWHR